jgi:membrane protein implicated in regulation of membrane protease activity
MYAAVSPYPHSALAAWQLALIAVVAFAGVAVWLGAVFLAAREPRARDHAAASQAPGLPSAAPAAEARPAPHAA